MEKLNLFISQRMKDKSEEEILADRERIISEVKSLYKDKEINPIDSYFKENTSANILIEDSVPKDRYGDALGMYYLGRSISLLALADIAYFAFGALGSRGCRLEYEVATKYNIPIILREVELVDGTKTIVKDRG